ncbi:MAG: zinc ribbon domain-containing protein [Oscillospiraceae bacterium]|nr:zinc ribbon domain-containing protein [Oscillospiraceae bacterium]
MNLTEKAAYLKGLKDGLKLDTEKAEGKLISAIIDLLDEMAESVTDIEDMSYAVTEELDAVEEELDSIEDALDGIDDEDEPEDDDESDDDSYEFDDEVIYEVKCPKCGEVINLDEEMLDAGGIECPNCGEALEFDASDLDEDEE